MNLHKSGILLYILWILESSTVHSLPVAQHPVVIPSSNNLSIFMSLFPMKTREKLTKSKVAESCPQLWAATSADFDGEQSAGKLGYLDELQKQCYSKENMSFSCQGAIMISSYLCDASSSGFTSKKWPEPPKVDNAKALCDPIVLCEEMANPELLNNLCRIKKTVDSSRTDLNCAPQDVVRHFCNSSCFQENNRLCQIILQGFKTGIYWESLKETDAADVNGEEDNFKTTAKILPDVVIPDDVPEKVEMPESETVPKPNSDVKVDNTLTSKPVGEETEADEQSELKKDSTEALKTEPLQPTSPPSVAGNSLEKNPIETTKTESETKTLPPTTVAIPAIKTNPNEKEENPLKPSGDELNPEVAEETLPPTLAPVYVIPPADDRKFSEDITLVENDDHYDPDDGEDDMVRPLTDGSEETNFLETQEPLVPKAAKPVNSVESVSEIDEPENTHFLLYFLTFVALSATGYVLYQRRGRIFTYLVGGRGSRRRSSSSSSTRAGGVNRSGSYKKLVNNLEEAMASSSVKNSNVIY